MNDDTISRKMAVDICRNPEDGENAYAYGDEIEKRLKALPSAQPEIIRCKDCEHWRQQTNFQGDPLLFGFCESDDMWQSLYGKTYEVAHIDTDYDFYCGYAKRITDE